MARMSKIAWQNSNNVIMIFQFELETPTTVKTRTGKPSSTKNFPFLNRLMTSNPRSRHSTKKYWEKQVLKAIADTPKPKTPIDNWYAHYIWHVPFSMDASNVAAGIKHIEDALVVAGVIVEDRLTHMGTTNGRHIAPTHEIIKAGTYDKKVVVRYSDKPFFQIDQLQ